MGVTLPECAIFRCSASVAYLAIKPQTPHNMQNLFSQHFRFLLINPPVLFECKTVVVIMVINWCVTPGLVWCLFFILYLLWTKIEICCLSVYFCLKRMRRTACTNYYPHMKPQQNWLFDTTYTRHDNFDLLQQHYFKRRISLKFRPSTWLRCFRTKIPSAKIIFSV